MMKRIAVCLLTICLAVVLTACGGGKSVEVDLDALAADLVGSDAFAMDMSQNLTPSNVAAGTYRYEEKDVVNSIMYYNTGTAEEIFLAKAANADAAKTLAELCQGHVDEQIAWMQNYIPEAVPRLENAVLETVGDYVLLVVADNSATAKSIVDGYIG